MVCVALIPARGGSKEIPKKNIKKFLGKPIIKYVIQVAKKSNLFQKVIVSTDSQKIANIAKKEGVLVHMRNKKLSKDNVTTAEVVLDVIKNKKFNYFYPSKICCLYPTSVFVTLRLLKKANKILSKKLNYIFSAVKYGHPVLRSFKKKNNNKPIMLFKKYERIQTNKLPLTYHDAGQFYFGWTKSWFKKKKVFNTKSKFIELNALESHDIDSLDDWHIAEIKYKNFFNK